MKRHLLLSLVFAIAMAFQVKAQDRHCAAHEIHEEKLASNPEYARQQQQLERLTQNYIADLKAGKVVGSNVVIPCIVHVVYANAQENISTAQVQSQIDRLNDDFSATNSDYNSVPSTFTSVRSGDTQIRFELMEVKRYSDSRATWGTNDAVKSSYPPIEPERILNMWVADIGGGILGYAQFPGGSLSTDGVVMSPQYFGDASKGSGFYLSAPFNLGRTATHEVGHWLNLRHIWGDGNCSADDFVNDTPVAGAPNYGCPSAGTNSCSGGQSDMFMNYMDYVDDACMFMFSAGQDARMQATFSSSRSGFLQDPTYTPGGGSGGGGGGTTCDDTEVSFTLVYDQYPAETSWTLKKGSTTVASGNGSGASANSTANQTLCLADGDYTFTINDSYGDGICCSYGNGSYIFTNGSSTLASGGQFTSTDTKSFTIGSTGGGGGGGTGGGSAVLGTYDFESGGFQGWADGGSDCARYTGGTYSYGGSASIRIRDNSGTGSSMSSPTFAAASYDAVEVEFFFYANSMENNEDFWVQASTNGGSSYSTIATYARGADFNNGTFYSATVTVPASNNLKIRFRCDASGNNDQIYIDDVTVTGISNARLRGNTLTALGTLNKSIADLEDTLEGELESDFSVYPNPATSTLNVRLGGVEKGMVQIYSISGQLVREIAVIDESATLDISTLEKGIYIVKATSEAGTFTKRFVKQ